MNIPIPAVITIPFVGTALGALTALLLRRGLPESVNRACGGFAAGVMTAASVWSLLLPAIAQAESGGLTGFFAVAGGFCAGILCMILTETAINALYRKRNGKESALSGVAFLILAVTLHNVPEGLAVGVACAGLAEGAAEAAGVTALSLGIALQNIPEGAIISLPLRTKGAGRMKACGAGALSGAVEPAAAVIALLAASPIIRLMPFFLSAAAGAMLYVTVQELIPEAAEGGSRTGSLTFAAGFLLMMTMDVLL